MGAITTRKKLTNVAATAAENPPIPKDREPHTYETLRSLPWAYVPGSAELGLSEWVTTVDLASETGQGVLTEVFGASGPKADTPELHQRTIDLRHVAAMLSDAQAGAWRLTGQTAVVTTDERGLGVRSGDFQHRGTVARQLYQWIVQQGKKLKNPPRMPVTLVYHSDPSVFPLIDTGLTRSPRHMAEIGGCPRELAGEYATAVGFLISRCEGRGYRYDSPYRRRVSGFLKDSPTLLQSVQWVLDLESSVKSQAATKTRIAHLHGILPPSRLCGGLAYLAVFDSIMGQIDAKEGKEKLDPYFAELIYSAGSTPAPAESFDSRQTSWRECLSRVCWGSWPHLEFRRKGSIGATGEELAADCYFLAGKPIDIREVVENEAEGGIVGDYRDSILLRIGDGSKKIDDTPSIDSRIDAVVQAYLAFSSGKWPKVARGEPKYPRFRSRSEYGATPMGSMTRLGGFDTADRDAPPDA